MTMRERWGAAAALVNLPPERKSNWFFDLFRSKPEPMSQEEIQSLIRATHDPTIFCSVGLSKKTLMIDIPNADEEELIDALRECNFVTAHEYPETVLGTVRAELLREHLEAALRDWRDRYHASCGIDGP